MLLLLYRAPVDRDSLSPPLAGPRVRPRPLAPRRQTTAVTHATVCADLDKSLNVALHLTALVALDL